LSSINVSQLILCGVNDERLPLSISPVVEKQIFYKNGFNFCVKPLKLKFHYADFHRNFPPGKVVDTNYESRGHKRWQIMKPWSFGESRRHKSRKSRTQTISTCQDVCDKVRDKFATNPFVSL